MFWAVVLSTVTVPMPEVPRFIWCYGVSAAGAGDAACGYEWFPLFAEELVAVVVAALSCGAAGVAFAAASSDGSMAAAREGAGRTGFSWHRWAV